MIEAASFGAGKKCDRNNAHRFLRVISAVAVRHPGGAEDLEFAKGGVNKMRREPVQRDEKQEHDQSAQNESGNG